MKSLLYNFSLRSLGAKRSKRVVNKNPFSTPAHSNPISVSAAEAAILDAISSRNTSRLLRVAKSPLFIANAQPLILESIFQFVDELNDYKLCNSIAHVLLSAASEERPVPISVLTFVSKIHRRYLMLSQRLDRLDKTAFYMFLATCKKAGRPKYKSPDERTRLQRAVVAADALQAFGEYLDTISTLLSNDPELMKKHGKLIRKIRSEYNARMLQSSSVLRTLDQSTTGAEKKRYGKPGKLVRSALSRLQQPSTSVEITEMATKISNEDFFAAYGTRDKATQAIKDAIYAQPKHFKPISFFHDSKKYKQYTLALPQEATEKALSYQIHKRRTTPTAILARARDQRKTFAPVASFSMGFSLWQRKLAELSAKDLKTSGSDL